MSPRMIHFYLNIHRNVEGSQQNDLDDWKVSGVISELHCVDHRFDRDSVLPETIHAIPSLKITKNDLSVHLLGSDHEIEIRVFLEIETIDKRFHEIETHVLDFRSCDQGWKWQTDHKIKSFFADIQDY